MDGKNCFRTRWAQNPLYSGGSIASVALPRRSIEHIRAMQQAEKTVSEPQRPIPDATAATLPFFTECLVLPCGDTINVVLASTGELVCSYTLPVEDVILHVDAVSILSEDRHVPFGQRAMSRQVATVDADDGSEKREGKKANRGPSQKGKGKSASAKTADVKVEKEQEEVSASEPLDPEFAVPMGCYIACGTRSLQLYMMQIVITESVPLPVNKSATTDGAVESASSEGAAELEPVVQYDLRVLRSWTAAQQAISIVNFSNGGQFLISGSTDGSIKVWNAFHHYLTHNFRCPSSSLLQTIYLDPTESYLICGSFEGHISVFDFVGKTLLAHSRPHVQAVDAIAVAEDGSRVFSIARDRRLSIQSLTPPVSEPAVGGKKRSGGVGTATPWSLQEERAVVVREHVSAALFENPHTLHIGSMDGVLTTYRVDGSSTNTGPAATALYRSAKPPSTKDEELSGETMMKCILRCDRPKGTVRSPTLKGFRVEDTHGDQHSPLFVADAGYNVSRYIYNEAAQQYKASGTIVGFLDQILDIKTFAPGLPHPEFPYERVIVNNSKDVRLYGSQGCFSGQVLQGHTDIVMCCAVSSDALLIATGGKDKEVRFWSTSTWQTVALGVKGHTAEITSMCFNAKQSDSYLLLFTISADENLRLWDAGQHVLPALKKQAASHAPADANQRSPVAFEHRTGINAAHAGPVFAVAVAPNDQYVATGGKDKVINLWNISGKKIYKESTLKGHRRGISSLAFSPADRVLASAANDGSVRLWSLVSLSCVKTLQVDKVAVLQVSFFNQGTQLITGNAEGVLRVWAVAASEAVWTSETHQEKIWALSVVEREDETVFLSGAADGVLVATEDFTAEEAERIKQDRHDVILKEQALTNAIRRGEFTEAFLLALQLNHPRHLRQVLVKWCAVDQEQCEDTLKGTLLPELSAEHILRLLQFAREWITNSRHCVVASLVIYCFLGSQHFEELAKLPAMRVLVEPLLAYSQRHGHRQHELMRRTYYIDYVTQSGFASGGGSQRTLTSMPPFVSAQGKRILGDRIPSPASKKARA